MLRFDPFRDIDRLAEQLVAQPGQNRVPRFMPMDLFKADGHHVLHADLPGVDPGSISVDVENDVLTVTAQRSASGGDDAVQWLANERFAGTYQRRISLGDGVDTAAITATYDNGVLTLTIPVAERAKPRRIAVQTSTEGPRTIESVPTAS
ncbi:Hsp20/alpha crystallin family protein [Jatrophihabitans sp. YIM 134969]